jgi:hypothetical protein
MKSPIDNRHEKEMKTNTRGLALRLSDDAGIDLRWKSLRTYLQISGSTIDK